MVSSVNYSVNTFVQTKQSIDIEEVRANVRKEDRIIDALEPVLNQHRLIVDRGLLLTGTSSQIQTLHLKNDSSICYSIK